MNKKQAFYNKILKDLTEVDRVKLKVLRNKGSLSNIFT
jgi:hypothetical protein